jgi:hypothetical protein
MSSPALSFVSVGAAAVAAGDKLLLLGAAWGAACDGALFWGITWLIGGSGLGSSR